MTEQEYIDATNLAKLRTATTIVRDCLPIRAEEEGFEKEVLWALRKWIERLEMYVSCADQQTVNGILLNEASNHS